MKEETATALPIRQLCSVALMSAIMCLLGPVSIPIGPVPISAMTLVIYLTLYVLGMKLGTISCAIYLMLGFVGVPVFAGMLVGTVFGLIVIPLLYILVQTIVERKKKEQ